MAQPQDVRERTQELERASLSAWATLAHETKGRDRYEADDPLRTVFQADRERIMGSAAWDALAGKTSTLPATGGRTRLAETVDVVAVARGIARALRLNEDLTEAIALGQALGATPFGAAGEEGLTLATGDPYRPEGQALRIVERLERGLEHGLEHGGEGLNLTWETRDGILHQRWDGPSASTLEGEAARFARRFVNVSLAMTEAADAAVGMLDDDGLRFPLLGRTHAARLDRLSLDLVRTSAEQPGLALGETLHAALEAAHLAAAARLAERSAVLHSHARAVHCTASLAIFLLEQGAQAPGPDAAPENGLAARVEVVDTLAASTDADLIARYRAAFEPALR